MIGREPKPPPVDLLGGRRGDDFHPLAVPADVADGSDLVLPMDDFLIDTLTGGTLGGQEGLDLDGIQFRAEVVDVAGSRKGALDLDGDVELPLVLDHTGVNPVAPLAGSGIEVTLLTLTLLLVVDRVFVVIPDHTVDLRDLEDGEVEGVAGLLETGIGDALERDGGCALLLHDRLHKLLGGEEHGVVHGLIPFDQKCLASEALAVWSVKRLFALLLI